MSSYKETLSRNLSNLAGWRTRRKLIVFESDDWGSIRMPSLSTFETLEKSGLNLSVGDARRYNTNDTIATVEDLQKLFDVLSSFRDCTGRSPVFTVMSLVANPDFAKIKASEFTQYHFEPITKTMERYYGNENEFELWKEGMRSRLFEPQFHGREHLNVLAWMRALRNGDPHTRYAFDHGLWSFKNLPIDGVRLSYQAAFDLMDVSDIPEQKEILRTGLDLFHELFGYRATYFVPPNGPINNALEETAFEKGVRYVSTSKIQLEAMGRGRVRKRMHYLGQRNKYGQRYITRNCFFEPTQADRDWVDTCLNEIGIAFRWHKPAVISTHRVNYIGALNKANREKGLAALSSLLEGIIERWPQVEFFSSSQLGSIIDERQ